jgi:hypothetical protein
MSLGLLLPDGLLEQDLFQKSQLKGMKIMETSSDSSGDTFEGDD